MATSFHCFRTAPIISAASSSHDRTKPDSNRPKLPVPNSNWFTPLFGWASNPDYIQQVSTSGDNSNSINTGAPLQQEKDRARPKFQPGCFTEEKAKELRKMTIETSTFHDIMYHSAIASRLASDVSGRQSR